MTTKQIRVPGPDHPITIVPAGVRLRIRVGDAVIVETGNALKLQEANYPAVYYVPLADVDMSKLVDSTHVTYCPYKGDCNYFSIPSGGDHLTDSVWTYRQPYPSVAEIAGHLAFYADRMDAFEVS